MKKVCRPLALLLALAGLLLPPPPLIAAAPAPAAVLTVNYLRYLLCNHVQAQGRQLVAGAPAAHQPGLQRQLDQWLDTCQDNIREDLEAHFPEDAREQFEDHIRRFTQAEQDADLDYLAALGRAVGWPGDSAEGYGAFRRWGIERWVADDMQESVTFLATLSGTIENLSAAEAAPTRPVDPLRAAEAAPAPLTTSDAPAGAPLQQFSTLREQRRQRALESAHAGMAQIAAERDAWEQEYAATKEAKAQAEAQALQAQAERLAATDQEALEQRKNSFRSRAVNVIAGVASATVSGFTGAIAGRAADEAVHAIFDRK